MGHRASIITATCPQTVASAEAESRGDPDTVCRNGAISYHGSTCCYLALETVRAERQQHTYIAGGGLAALILLGRLDLVGMCFSGALELPMKLTVPADVCRRW